MFLFSRYCTESVISKFHQLWKEGVRPLVLCIGIQQSHAIITKNHAIDIDRPLFSGVHPIIRDKKGDVTQRN